ncbi:hypothetical protein PIB30_066933 [Stylosanthes scabra]|uniref:Uncharacterized protein n=1 Tax=Stylosanthes scabra TaxID=79078 RepID=A0ABU6WKR6_9FABA|nr:hypothetical protein [Stylosanthes scabra]
MAPTSFSFPNQLSASRPDSIGVGSSSNPSLQTPIHFSPNSQYLEFANTRGLDAIDLINDEIENLRQESIHHWQWEEDEMLISVWLNVSTDPILGTDQNGDTFGIEFIAIVKNTTQS